MKLIVIIVLLTGNISFSLTDSVLNFPIVTKTLLLKNQIAWKFNEKNSKSSYGWDNKNHSLNLLNNNFDKTIDELLKNWIN